MFIVLPRIDMNWDEKKRDEKKHIQTIEVMW